MLSVLSAVAPVPVAPSKAATPVELRLASAAMVVSVTVAVTTPIPP